MPRMKYKNKTMMRHTKSNLNSINLIRTWKICNELKKCNTFRNFWLMPIIQTFFNHVVFWSEKIIIVWTNKNLLEKKQMGLDILRRLKLEDKPGMNRGNIDSFIVWTWNRTPARQLLSKKVNWLPLRLSIPVDSTITIIQKQKRL